MNRIKEILNEKGIKQTWLAEKLGKSFKIVNAYACNRQQPPIDTLYKIAEILQVSVKDLLVDSIEKINMSKRECINLVNQTNTTNKEIDKNCMGYMD